MSHILLTYKFILVNLQYNSSAVMTCQVVRTYQKTGVLHLRSMIKEVCPENLSLDISSYKSVWRWTGRAEPERPQHTWSILV